MKKIMNENLIKKLSNEKVVLRESLLKYESQEYGSVSSKSYSLINTNKIKIGDEVILNEISKNQISDLRANEIVQMTFNKIGESLTKEPLVPKLSIEEQETEIKQLKEESKENESFLLNELIATDRSSICKQIEEIPAYLSKIAKL